jgi:hypothetical protein
LLDSPGGGHALLLVVAFAVVAPICVAPLGISITHGDVFSGRYARAWAPLPLRPESVRRTVYVHALLTTTLVWLLFLAHSLVVASLGLRGWGWPWTLPLGLVIPCAAGFLLCGAVGDRRRGFLSAATLATFLPVHLVTLTGVWKDILGLSSGKLDLGVLLALALLGGVPPLVHLRRSVARA